MGRTNEIATVPGMDIAPSAPPARLRTLASWLINQTAIPANRIVAGRLARVGARRHHYSLLVALAEQGPTSQAALSQRTTIDRSDIVAALNELAESGYVARTPDPTDRRRNIVTITTTGRRRLRSLDELVTDAQDELLTPLSKRERDDLTRLLTRIVDHHAGG
jgi:DNA-binding MarR family transcriptional regulator